MDGVDSVGLRSSLDVLWRSGGMAAGELLRRAPPRLWGRVGLRRFVFGWGVEDFESHPPYPGLFVHIV